MSQHIARDERAFVDMRHSDDFPEGMIDYAARVAIRDLIRLYGFESAREHIAFMLMDEADRRPS